MKRASTKDLIEQWVAAGNKIRVAAPTKYHVNGYSMCSPYSNNGLASAGGRSTYAIANRHDRKRRSDLKALRKAAKQKSNRRWHKEPMTAKQKTLLQKLGRSGPLPRTRGAASVMIDDMIKRRRNSAKS